MKKLYKLSLKKSEKQRFLKNLLLALTCTLLSSTAALAQLSGTYTVCGSGCDYNTIQKAADDLKSKGINASVTISIKPGTYKEQVRIGTISGTSAGKTVTFKGAGTKNTDVWVYNSLDTVWSMDADSFVTLENLHVETQNWWGPGVHTICVTRSANINILNCRATSYMLSGTSSNFSVVCIQNSVNVKISGCYLRGANSAINDGGDGKNKNLTIEKSLLTKFYSYGTELYYNTNTSYLNNTFDSTTGSFSLESAIYGYGDGGTVTIKGNTIIEGGEYPVYITYSQNSSKFFIDSNYLSGGWNGIAVLNTKASTKLSVTRNRIRGQLGVGSNIMSIGDVDFFNNMIDGVGQSLDGVFIEPYASTGQWRIMHNTISLPNSAGAGIYLYNPYRAKDIFIKNNLLADVAAGYNLDYLINGNQIDGNDLSTSGGTIAKINGTSYSSFSAVKSALFNITGTGNNEQNSSVSFANSPKNLHLDQTSPAPFGVQVGITTDYDGNNRCDIMPTIGADESTNTSSDNLKTLSGTKFTSASKSYTGYPTTFLNSASSNSRLRYRWYVNGKKVSDSFNLYTTALTYPKACVKLEAYNCAHSDTFVSCITIDSPTVAPSTDFIADKTLIRQGDTVTLTDISTGYPSAWTWEITPLIGVLNGTTTSAYKYLAGNKNTPRIGVRFDIPGMYKVCLTAANAKGKGATECKTDYIEVISTVTMETSIATATGSTGYIYDNGGPNGITMSAPYFSSLPKVLIDPCADSVYLVFKSFSMNCGYEYVRVYEGKNKQSGKLLTCSANMQFGAYGPGLTGSATTTGCTQNCPPIHKGSTAGTFLYDTFKAAKSMYIEMESNNPGSQGFEAYYWTKPSSLIKPKASFTSRDSLCTNGKMFFTNKTSGGDVKYFWDLDGNPADIEDTAKNPSWSYFAPGKYRITLYASNCAGLDSFSKTIFVFNPVKPVAGFKADNRTPATSDVVFFSPNISMCVDGYRWTIKATSGSGKASFVNGTKNTSANPDVTFSDTGCYSVTLFTQNVSGDDSVELSCYIRVRAPYCTPTTVNKAADLGISQVIFNKINNKTPQGTTSYTSYVNDPLLSTTLQKGELHELTVSRSTNSNKISRTAWIDWNIDGVFDTATEKIGFQKNSTSLSWTTQVNIPKSAKNGATVLRIATNIGSQDNTPCGPNAYGEYEDYRVYVTADVTKPVMALIGDDSVFVEQCQTYIDSGATALDNVNGNLTPYIGTTTTPAFNNKVPGTYVRTYSVSDSAFNKGMITRVITVKPDKTPPEITLFGPDTAYYEVFQFMHFDSLVALDCGNATPLPIIATHAFNPNVIGTYVIKYSATDAAGNTATKIQVIIIQDKTEPTMTLIGNATIVAEVGKTFTDPGVNLSDNYYSSAELQAVLVMKSNVDLNKLGKYTVTYTLTDPSGNGPVTVTRTVIIVDSQPPVISIKGANPFYLEVNHTFADPGITISDNYDKNLTSWDSSGTFYTSFPNGFANKLGTYTVIYTVDDLSGNKASVTRTVIVQDTTPPAVKLIGQPTVTLCRWQAYTDEGVEVSDNFYSKSSLKVEKEGSFLLYGTQKPGLFSLRYKVTDGSGNIAYSAERGIVVQEPNTGPCATGLNDNGNIDKLVTIFPNPSSGKVIIRINTPESETVKITVVNSLGQRVATVEGGLLNTGTYAIDLSAQSSGVYLVTVQTATRSATKKLILAR